LILIYIIKFEEIFKNLRGSLGAMENHSPKLFFLDLLENINSVREMTLFSSKLLLEIHIHEVGFAQADGLAFVLTKR
jgi:hypothetical protein